MVNVFLKGMRCENPAPGGFEGLSRHMPQGPGHLYSDIHARHAEKRSWQQDRGACTEKSHEKGRRQNQGKGCDTALFP